MARSISAMAAATSVARDKRARGLHGTPFAAMGCTGVQRTLGRKPMMHQGRTARLVGSAHTLLVRTPMASVAIFNYISKPHPCGTTMSLCAFHAEIAM